MIRFRIVNRKKIVAKYADYAKAVKRVLNSPQTLAEFRQQITTTWRAEADPYGIPWQQRKHAYKHPINLRTGKLLRATKLKVVGGNIELSNNKPYAKFVDFIRPIILNKRHGLPHSWLQILKRRLRKVTPP